MCERVSAGRGVLVVETLVAGTPTRTLARFGATSFATAAYISMARTQVQSAAAAAEDAFTRSVLNSGLEVYFLTCDGGWGTRRAQDGDTRSTRGAQEEGTREGEEDVQVIHQAQASANHPGNSAGLHAKRCPKQSQPAPARPRPPPSVPANIQ